MKLLLDEHLSRRIVPFLQGVYPGSTQVALIGMERASDREIWEYAQTNGFVIVTKDSDFYDLSLVLGAPPQVVWLKTGNTTKAAVTRALLDNQAAVERLAQQEGVTCIEIY
jgi:predicted nuclease of predicted toxin-antitoxin system